MTRTEQRQQLGELYQLVSDYQLTGGSLVHIGGPHDTYGIVINSKPKEGTTLWVNLIRGQGKDKPRQWANKKPSYKF